ncbi:hypothetical protein [Kribbella deserti]|uniref:Uncharacterized protein n=1 Tax=Kribbella deserti TaxID=1926257 RepID=A0ABV6QFC3_9ACTN
MSTEITTSTGGFAGDPAAAFTPPAAGSCCGSTPSSQAGSEAPQASGCCGTDTAVAASSCCGEAPVGQAVEPAAAGGCCG